MRYNSRFRLPHLSGGGIYFEVEWVNTENSFELYRLARAGESYIVVDAPHEDVDLDLFKAHLYDTIERTNTRYREHLLNEAQKKSKEQAQAELEERRLLDLKRRLKLNNDED